MSFLVRLVAYSLLVIGLIAWGNYGIDVDQKFPKNQEERVVEWINAGKPVANFQRTHERMVYQMLVASKKQAECIVLGSSRGFGVDKSLFASDSFYNYSLSEASLQDYLALIGLMHEHAVLPQKVLLVVDPWLFNANNQLVDWVLWQDAYVSFARHIELRAVYSPKWQAPPIDFRALLHLAYLKKNLRFLIEGGSPWAFPTEDLPCSVPVKLPDGSLLFPEMDRQASLKEIYSRAEHMAYAHHIDLLEGYTELDKVQSEHFEKLIQFLLSNEVEVLLYLPPFNPIVWGKIQNDPAYKSVLTCESFLTFFSKKYNLSLMGSYNPHNLYLNPGDFYDGKHLSREAIHRFLERGVQESPRQKLWTSLSLD